MSNVRDVEGPKNGEHRQVMEIEGHMEAGKSQAL